MAYGGPASLDEIPGYLADIRHGRPTPRAVLDEITENYRAIGGSSPLLEMSRRQVDALAGRLGDEFRCYLGMRHWSPWIEEVVGEMVDDGVTHAVSLVLAPHFSALSVARYQQKIADGLELYRGRIQFEHVPSYHDAPGLVEAFAARVEEGLVALAGGRARARARRLQRAQPSGARARVGRPVRRAVPRDVDGSSRRGQVSPTSAGRGPTSRPDARPRRGRGPISVSTSRQLAARGVRDVVSVPIGFVSDHVELLFDVDRRARGIAEGLGMRLERPAGAERRARLHRCARRHRARARGAVARGSAGGVKVVVVGGGIAGLTAARRLEDLGADASADRERRRARRKDQDRARRRFRDRGGAGQLPRAKGARRRAVRGARPRRRAHRAPAGAPAHVRAARRRAPSAPGGPHGDDPGEPRRARAQRAPLSGGQGPLRCRARASPRQRRDDDESVASFVARRFGREAYEALVEPLHDRDLRRRRRAALAPSDVSPAARLSSSSTAASSRALPAHARPERLGPFVSLRSGMDRLVSRLVEGLDPHPGPRGPLGRRACRAPLRALRGSSRRRRAAHRRRRRRRHSGVCRGRARSGARSGARVGARGDPLRVVRRRHARVRRGRPERIRRLRVRRPARRGH